MSLSKAAGPFFVSSLLQWSGSFTVFTKQSFASIGNSKQFFDIAKMKKTFSCLSVVYVLSDFSGRFYEFSAFTFCSEMVIFDIYL